MQLASLGDYADRAATLPRSCAVNDDLSRQSGDPAEEMVARALDFIVGWPYTPISAAQAGIATHEAPVGRVRR